MLAFRLLAVAVVCSISLLAQDSVVQPAPTEDPDTASIERNSKSDPPVQAPEDKRIFGVLPNNRTTENALPFHRITAGQKMTIAFKDSFDWPVYITSGLFASLYQIENQNPSFGQGMSGFGKRVGTSYADQMMGNMMTEGIVPALFHQDPRYFRLNEGSKAHRAWYAVTRIAVARMDSGRNSFNFSEWGGNAVAVGLSNLYYPDTRTAKENASKLLIQCGTDAFANVLKEFWPDVKHWIRGKRQEGPTSLGSLSAR
jgi:hypothetical protein